MFDYPYSAYKNTEIMNKIEEESEDSYTDLIRNPDSSSKRFELKYNFNYSVHRQFKGRFTPMSFEVMFSFYSENKLYVPDIYKFKYKVDKLLSPYINEALMVDVDSHFFVHMLKGQDQGYNRKDLYDDIINHVKIEGKVWYSHNQIPPLTIQEQHIVSYDVGDPRHGPMRDPTNVVRHLVPRIEEIDTTVKIYHGQITSGDIAIRE
jgi:hypothetical protein